MSQTLKAEVLDLINDRGKMTRVQVFAHFELVARRYIERAIAELAEARKIVAGAHEVAPIRAAREVLKEPAPGECLDPQPTKPAPRGTTLPSQIIDVFVFSDDPVLTCREVIPRIRGFSSDEVRKEMSRMKGRGLLENPSRGSWRLPAEARS